MRWWKLSALESYSFKEGAMCITWKNFNGFLGGKALVGMERLDHACLERIKCL